METNERNTVIYSMGDCIAAPLGFGSENVFRAVAEGNSVARLHEGTFGLPEPFFGSLFERDWIDETFALSCPADNTRYTPFEKIAIIAASEAIRRAGIDPASDRVLFVVSTTKGNVHLLEDLQGFETERVYLWRSAQLIAQHFGNKNTPIVASNACISGVSAQHTAMAFLQNGLCDYAVVVGAEMLSKFIISGFQSFKALSPERCMPFDKDRIGLNLGEGAACIVFGKGDEDSLPQGTLIYCNSANCNDANHISGPSRTGEGLHNAIEKALAGYDRSKLAFINAHGTATPYNDDMESWAIFRSGLSKTPTNSLKGYFGHTLGAAGVLETIMSHQALKNSTVLPTKGHCNLGVAQPITVCTEKQTAHGESFIKLISGFGGSNAAIHFKVKL